MTQTVGVDSLKESLLEKVNVNIVFDLVTEGQEIFQSRLHWALLGMIPVCVFVCVQTGEFKIGCFLQHTQ